MAKSRGGIRVEDEIVGMGPVATRRSVVQVALSMKLSRGDVVLNAPSIDVDLSRRETIAGVRYGIEGMRVGGRRTFTVPPHLAYGENGVIGKIPPNAALRCEVTLLAVDRSE